MAIERVKPEVKQELKEIATRLAHLPRGYLSPSAMTTFWMCPHSYYLKYIEGIKGTVISSRMVEGSAGHKVLEENNKTKIETGEDRDKDDLVELWHDTWSEAAKEVNDWEEGMDEDAVHERGETWIGNYRSRYAAKFKPVSTEKEFNGMVNGVPVRGFIDLVTEEEGQPYPIIYDYKFTNRAKPQGEAESGVQLGLYSIVEQIPDVGYVNFVKTKEPKIVKTRGTRTPKSLEKVANAVKDISEAIKRGSFPCCDPASWKCNHKNCDVYFACKQGSGSK